MWYSMGLLGIETPYCGSFLLWKLWIHTLKLTHAVTCFCYEAFLWYLRTKYFLLKNLKLFPELRLKADCC